MTRSSLLPTPRDLATTAISAAFGVAAGALLTNEQRRRTTKPEQTPDVRVPDDPAWHAAVAKGRVRSPE